MVSHSLCLDFLCALLAPANYLAEAIALYKLNNSVDAIRPTAKRVRNTLNILSGTNQLETSIRLKPIAEKLLM